MAVLHFRCFANGCYLLPKRVFESGDQADKGKERNQKKAQEWRRRNERSESLCIGSDRWGVGAIGTLDPGHLSRSCACRTWEARNCQWDSLRLAEWVPLEIAAP